MRRVERIRNCIRCFVEAFSKQPNNGLQQQQQQQYNK